MHLSRCFNRLTRSRLTYYVFYSTGKNIGWFFGHFNGHFQFIIQFQLRLVRRKSCLFIEPSKSKGRVFHQARKNILRQRSSQQELTLKPHKSIKIGEIHKMGKKKWQIFAAAAMTVSANMIETEGVNQMDASSFLSRIK